MLTYITIAIVVSQDPKPRQIQVNASIVLQVLPWENFLKKLWSNEIIV